MRPVHRPGLRSWALLPAAVLVLSGLAAGCSSTPAYCTDASQLKTDVQNLGNVDINVHDLSSVNTAVRKVQADANKFAADAKSAYPSQTTALQNSLSSLENAIKSAQGQRPVAAAAAVVPAVTQVKNSASALQSAVSGKCS